MSSTSLAATLLCAAVTCLACAQAIAADPSVPAPKPGDKLILSAPLTHSDWMGKAGRVDGVVWGAEGVHHMLDACKAAGWSRIYWRCCDGGRSLYKSKLMVPQCYPQGKPESEYWTPLNPAVPNYSQFDSLAEAVSYGKKIGVQIHAWISINEDDHGGGIPSIYTNKHPESRWVHRDGTPYATQQSFAFPEVRAYKLSLIKEIVDNYRVAGVFLDWIRTGDAKYVVQTDADGVADYGYEEPLVKDFKAKYGIDPHDVPNSDPRWVQYRSQPITEFMRSVRKMLKAKNRKMPLSVMVYQPWAYRGNKIKIDGNLRGTLLDTTTWAKEGLIDEAVAAGYYLEGGDAAKGYEALKAETRGKVKLWLFGWVPSSVDEFSYYVDTARKVGAKQILFWEADYIDDRPNEAELQKAMSAVAVPAGKGK